MMKALQWFGSLPYSSLYVVTPNWFEVAVYFGIVFSLFHVRKSIPARAALAFLVVIGLADAAYWTVFAPLQR